jgi:hypothetical protein
MKHWPAAGRCSRKSRFQLLGHGYVEHGGIRGDFALHGRYHGKAPDEIDWSLPERQSRAVAEFLGALDDEDANADRKHKRVQFDYGLNYLIDIEYAVTIDVQPTPAPHLR